MKRILVSATVAVAVLTCAAAGTWIALVRGVASTMAGQARLAGELLDARTPPGDAMARTLVRPGIHVSIVDREAGTRIDAGSEGVTARPLPPGPPDFGGPPGIAGPPGFAPSGPLPQVVLGLARLAPVVVDRGSQTVEITPDPADLARWFAGDAAALVCGTLVIAGLAVARIGGRARDERRALEARVAERREQAERYQRFLAESGHELRTPLTVMNGYVDILRSLGKDEPLDERIVEGMHAEVSRMRVLVEKLMMLARLESDVAVPRLLDVASAARQAAQTLQRRYPERDVRVDASQTASIVIDADDYAAALGNLLENAVKYAPSSPIVIETGVRDGSAITTIVDRGPGIPEDDRRAIFERFYRGRGRTLGEGLGLGLAIVKRIAERWNGTVECESGSGRTSFRLSFPLADEEVYGVAR